MIKEIYKNIKNYFTKSEKNRIPIEDSFDESYLGVGAMMVPPGSSQGRKITKELVDKLCEEDMRDY